MARTDFTQLHKLSYGVYVNGSCSNVCAVLQTFSLVSQIIHSSPFCSPFIRINSQYGMCHAQSDVASACSDTVWTKPTPDRHQQSAVCVTPACASVHLCWKDTELNLKQCLSSGFKPLLCQYSETISIKVFPFQTTKALIHDRYIWKLLTAL